MVSAVAASAGLEPQAGDGAQGTSRMALQSRRRVELPPAQHGEVQGYWNHVDLG